MDPEYVRSLQVRIQELQKKAPCAQYIRLCVYLKGRLYECYITMHPWGAVSPFISPARKNVRPMKGQDHLDLEDPPALLWSSREVLLEELWLLFCSVSSRAGGGGGGGSQTMS